jgi:hypothetical protein
MLLAMSRALIAIFAFLLLTVSAIPSPREVLWSNKTFGPDGPWRAVQTQLGPKGTKIDLFPGSSWETYLIDQSYCKQDTCYASKAGTYDKKASGYSGGIGIQGPLEAFMLGVNLDGDDGTRWLDEVSFNGQTVKNTSLVLLTDAQTVSYPGGQKSPFFAGCLSLGGDRETNQSFTVSAGVPSINASLPSGYLWEHGATDSNSFGMHIGSVQPDLPGSLFFGGYDKNRVAGDILSMTGSFRSGITLWDVGIDVVDGKSPFSFPSNKTGLLSKSAGSGIKVRIDGCSPYITLPKAVCDNIAAELPVNFDDSLGLYLWDTNSDKYKEIVPSATALSFSFISDSNTDPIKVRVPFMHLNLTLTDPIATSPTPYFPCHVNNSTNYVLGRAFLQDAFVGGNWHPDVNKWWLAQAPGPSIQATTSVVTIGTKDSTIQKGGNNWEASWKGVWTAVEAAPSSSPTEDTSKNIDSGGSGGLSTAAKAGIGAGCGVAALALLALVVFLLRRRRRQQELAAQPVHIPVAQTPQTNSVYTSYTTVSKTPVNDAVPYAPPSELANDVSIQTLQREQARYERFELGT